MSVKSLGPQSQDAAGIKCCSAGGELQSWVGEPLCIMLALKNPAYNCVNLHFVLLSCRKVDLKPHELLQHVFIPFTEPNEYVREFKQVGNVHCMSECHQGGGLVPSLHYP